MSDRFAVIDASTMMVENFILARPELELEGKILVDVTGASIGALYDPETGEFTTQVSPLHATYDDAVSDLLDRIEGFTLSITGRVPGDEKASWTTKEDAARAIIAGTAQPYQTELVKNEALVTSESVEELAALIIVNADYYRFVVAATTGIRRTTETVLNGAEPSEYERILENASSALEELRR